MTWKAVDASYTVKKNLTVVMNKKLTRAAKETYKIVLVQLPNVEDQVQSCGENELGLEKDTIILVPHAPSNAKEMRASYYTSSTVTIVFC
ncbi:MAG: hypothetical protein HAW66_00925 [Shewanella sp.]|nr:hypothetical protein [Shewanella sp.]